MRKSTGVKFVKISKTIFIRVIVRVIGKRIQFIINFPAVCHFIAVTVCIFRIGFTYFCFCHIRQTIVICVFQILLRHRFRILRITSRLEFLKVGIFVSVRVIG